MSRPIKSKLERRWSHFIVSRTYFVGAPQPICYEFEDLSVTPFRVVESGSIYKCNIITVKPEINCLDFLSA
jgi:hypothetical protein